VSEAKPFCSASTSVAGFTSDEAQLAENGFVVTTVLSRAARRL
jgi:CDGSH-type Zn-finger protein